VGERGRRGGGKGLANGENFRTIVPLCHKNSREHKEGRKKGEGTKGKKRRKKGPASIPHSLMLARFGCDARTPEGKKKKKKEKREPGKEKGEGKRGEFVHP